MPTRMFAMSIWTSNCSIITMLSATVFFLTGCNQSSDDSFSTISEGDIKVARVDESLLKKPEIEVSSQTETSENLEIVPERISPTPVKETKDDNKNDSKKEEMTSIDESREIKLLVKEKTFKTVGPEGAIRVSYDDIDLLKVLNMEKAIPEAVDYFPDWLNELDGKRVRIRGFMYPLKATNIKRFMLTRDTDVCCFGPKAKIYDRFPVKMRKGESTDYIFNRPFDVVGIFRIDPFIDKGDDYKDILELYRIEDAIIIQ